MNTGEAEGAPLITVGEIRQAIEERIQAAISRQEQFSMAGFPEVADTILIPALKALLQEYVSMNDTDRFLMLFHTFKYLLDSSALTWEPQDKKKKTLSINLGIKQAIKELWEDKGLNPDGDALLRVAMKLNIVEQNEVRGIQDMVGVSESSVRDRMA
ncbi:hypothetical protein HY732_05325 [Candidatus Uhrbacteria bacterium]|nr:hypothetical protein [Candidatus Uhrbacteria bacterium]